MRSAILMGSVAAIALATPALALPDRYEQGYSCTGQGALCTQEQMRLEDGNRFDEKGNSALNSDNQGFGQNSMDRRQPREATMMTSAASPATRSRIPQMKPATRSTRQPTRLATRSRTPRMKPAMNSTRSATRSATHSDDRQR